MIATSLIGRICTVPRGTMSKEYHDEKFEGRYFEIVALACVQSGWLALIMPDPARDRDHEWHAPEQLFIGQLDICPLHTMKEI